jgi:hypothetical protein
MKNLFVIWEDLDRRFGAGVFYTALVLMLCSYAWFSFRVWDNEMHEILIFIRRLPLILFGIRIVLLGGRHPKYMLGCLLVSAVLFMSSRITDNRELLRLGMAVMASREVRNRITVRIYQWLYLLVPLAGLILYLLGIAFDLQTHELGMEGHSWTDKPECAGHAAVWLPAVCPALRTAAPEWSSAGGVLDGCCRDMGAHTE